MQVFLGNTLKNFLGDRRGDQEQHAAGNAADEIRTARETEEGRGHSFSRRAMSPALLPEYGQFTHP